MRFRSTLAPLCAILVLAACSSSQEKPKAEIPAIPQISSAQFPAEFRDRFDALYEQARSTPTSVSANGDVAMLLHAYDQLQPAETFYQRAAALEPGALKWPYYLGVVRSRLSRHEEAQASFREALEVDPTFVPARIRVAQSLADEEKFAEAEELFRKILADAPDAAEAHYGLGQALSAQGESEEAVEHFRKACDLAPNYGPAHYALAMAYRDLGDDAASREQLALYEQDRTGVPPSSDPLMIAVSSLRASSLDFLAQGVRLEEAGDLEGALQAHLRAVALDPRYVQAHVNLLILYGRMGRYEEALAHYRQALDASPDRADLHYNFGVLSWESGHPDQAFEAFQKTIESNPDYAMAHAKLGRMLQDQGRMEEAGGHYAKALESMPGQRLLHYHLAQTLVARKRFAEAIREYEQTLEPRDEMTPRFLFELAAAHGLSGRKDRALALAGDAQKMAREMGQADFAAEIEARLKNLR